jgi:four helix bundle protein
MFRFEKLEVWQKAVELAEVVYTLTRAFPGEERFGLTSQMRRAVVSVSSNIAEGSSRNSDAEFARFVEIAYGSLMEIVSQALVAHRLSFLQEQPLKAFYEKAEEEARMLSGLRGRLTRK